MRTLVLLALALAACRSRHDDRDVAAPLIEEASSSTRDTELSTPRPIFTVTNFRAAQAYYRDKLGFELRWDHGDPASFGAVVRSQLELFICAGCDHSPGSWAMVFTRDLDTLHEELVRRGALIKMPPTKMPWGLREMHVSDPDGNVIRFGSGD